MKTAAWQERRHRAVHMTIRDIDCADFDAEATIATFKRLNITLFSFFAGGYVTTYPSRLPWQRVSRHLAPGRDLCGELIEAAHRAGIVAFPMVDLGELPLDLAREHPEWAAQQADGSPYLKTDTIAVSCPLGHYRRGLARELVAELKERYGDNLDGIKWGGASYGFPHGLDHNPIAVEAFTQATGRPLPASAGDPGYTAWRQRIMAETIAHLRAVVHEVAGVPVVGNSVWNLGDGIALEELVRHEDFTQVEIQTRTHNTPDDRDVAWQRFSTPIETTRYVAPCCRRPPWVVASYFLAWPWRRVAVPWPEQKLYLAQVAANGGCPMVNLTTGSPAHHPDPRGFRAIEELYGFIARHESWFQDDRSAAHVALVYDHAAAVAARGSAAGLHRGYLDELQALEDALDEQHVPYDLLSVDRLRSGDHGEYAAFVLPCIHSDDTELRERLAGLAGGGAGLVFTGRLPGPDWTSLAGAKPLGPPQPFHQGGPPGPLQAYLAVADPEHPLLDGIEVPLIAASGHWQPVHPGPAAAIALHRAAPFRLFPEGLSYTEAPDPAEPLAFCRAAETGGRTVCFAFELGRTIRRTAHPDARRLLLNALSWATEGRATPLAAGFRGLRLSLRHAPPGLALHCINTTGPARYLTEFTPVRAVPFTLPCPEAPASVRQASTGRELAFEHRGGRLQFTVSEIVDYDLIQICPASRPPTRSP
ncbi:MAG: hypothetical protein EA425_14155 [Puniceicoccaceae bacterium]|nr:MAG: hypothetical protein EA425_14155 [Puniceicoccaceae bacterium]